MSVAAPRTETARTSRRPGRVALVGTGPGDPQLLTVRASTLLRDADVLAADGPTPEALRACAAADVESLDLTGKTPSARARALVAAARGGRLVVRLLAGDPFLLSPGAEEATALAKAEVDLEVVPGISPAAAASSYAGVPLTDRSVRAVHLLDVAAGGSDPDWSALAAGGGTLVLIEGVGPVGRLPATLGKAAAALVEHGRPGDTPVAVVREGTTTAQSTLVSTLDGVETDTRTAGVDGPAVAVVGEVVGHREKLSWFENRPLFGWRVLVPRTKEQAASLADRLHALGATPVGVPTIAVEPPRSPAAMDRAIKGLVSGRYQWIAFTSANAVRAVREKIEDYGLDARAFSGVRIACVGEATAAAVRAYGIRPDLVPTGEQSSAGLLAEWAPYDDVLDPINRVLLPRADIATETLVAGLVERGWEVDDVTAYRTVRAAPPAPEIRESIKAGDFDAVLFTSSSTARNLVGIAGKPNDATVLAAIGPATARTLAELGLRCDVQAENPSVEDLVEALAGHALARRAAGLGRPSTMRAKRRK